MIEAAHVHAARGKPLRLVFQRRLECRRRVVALGLIIELDLVAIGIVAAIGGPVAEIVLDPADLVAGAFERGDAALQRLLAARAKRCMTQARGFRVCEL